MKYILSIIIFMFINKWFLRNLTLYAGTGMRIFIQLGTGTGLGMGIFSRVGKLGRGRGRIDPRSRSRNELDPYPHPHPCWRWGFFPNAGRGLERGQRFPAPLPSLLIREVHGGSLSNHFAKNKALLMLREHYYWPSMSKDVQDLSKRYATCQVAKSHLLS